MTGASPVTTIDELTRYCLIVVDSIVVTGLAPVMPPLPAPQAGL